MDRKLPGRFWCEVQIVLQKAEARSSVPVGEWVRRNQKCVRAHLHDK